MTTIYYAIKPPNKSPDNNFNTNPLFNMLDEQLIPLYKDLKQEQDKSVPREGSFFSCRAFIDYTKNMYVFKNPFDIKVRIEKSRVLNLGNRNMDHVFMNRMVQVQDAYNLNYDPGYVFFSEEPVNIEVMSPFMHRSGFNKNGYIVPGTYDISKWFRPLNPALQLYDNEDRVVESSKGDALMYIKFNCSDSVKLEKFYIDKELDSIIYGASGYKNYDPNRSLPYLYDKFEKAGLKKRTLKLIKENLIWRRLYISAIIRYSHKG